MRHIHVFYDCHSGKSCKIFLLCKNIRMPTRPKPGLLRAPSRKRRSHAESKQSSAMFSPPVQCDSSFVLGKHAKLMRPKQTEGNQEKGGLSRFRRYYFNGLFKTRPSGTLRMSKAASTTLKSVLENSNSFLAFRQFLAREFSDENLDFWHHCEKYKKEKPSKRLKLAKKIFETYVKDNAPREINIDSHTKREIKENLQSLDASMFDTAQTLIFTLMERDSFPRFLSSKSFSPKISSSKTDRKASLQPSASSSMLLDKSTGPSHTLLKRQSSL